MSQKKDVKTKTGGQKTVASAPRCRRVNRVKEPKKRIAEEAEKEKKELAARVSGGREKRLPPAQLRAIGALLAGKTVVEAAKQAHRTPKTVHHWFKTDRDFHAFFNSKLRELQDEIGRMIPVVNFEAYKIISDKIFVDRSVADAWRHLDKTGGFRQTSPGPDDPEELRWQWALEALDKHRERKDQLFEFIRGLAEFLSDFKKGRVPMTEELVEKLVHAHLARMSSVGESNKDPFWRTAPGLEDRSRNADPASEAEESGGQDSPRTMT